MDMHYGSKALQKKKKKKEACSATYLLLVVVANKPVKGGKRYSSHPLRAWKEGSSQRSSVAPLRHEAGFFFWRNCNLCMTHSK